MPVTWCGELPVLSPSRPVHNFLWQSILCKFWTFSLFIKDRPVSFSHSLPFYSKPLLLFLFSLSVTVLCSYHFWLSRLFALTELATQKREKGVSRIINHPVCCYHYGRLFGLKFCENNLLEISHKHNIWVSFHKQKIGHILYSQHCSMFSLVGCHLIHCSLFPFHPLSSIQADFSTARPEELCGGAEAAPKGGRQD